MDAQPARREVHLLICPLQAYSKYHFENLDFAASRNKLHHVPFRGLQHWALRVGEDEAFEVTSYGTQDGKPRFRHISVDDWWEDRKEFEHIVQDRWLGETVYETDYIEMLAKYTWDVVFQQQYRFASTNCQTFSSILQELIINNDHLTPRQKAQLDLLPFPLNPLIAISEKVKRIQRLATLVRKACTPSQQPEDSSPVESLAPYVPPRPGHRWLMALRAVKSDVRNKHDMHGILRTANAWRTKEKRSNLTRTLSFGAFSTSMPSTPNRRIAQRGVGRSDSKDPLLRPQRDGELE